MMTILLVEIEDFIEGFSIFLWQCQSLLQFIIEDLVCLPHYQPDYNIFTFMCSTTSLVLSTLCSFFFTNYSFEPCLNNLSIIPANLPIITTIFSRATSIYNFKERFMYHLYLLCTIIL